MCLPAVMIIAVNVENLLALDAEYTDTELEMPCSRALWELLRGVDIPRKHAFCET
jgi:hypothetical protein